MNELFKKLEALRIPEEYDFLLWDDRVISAEIRDRMNDMLDECIKAVQWYFDEYHN